MSFSTFAGNFEKCVTLLRDKHKSKDIAPVVSNIFSHANVPKKNQLTTMLIVSAHVITVTVDLQGCLPENRSSAQCQSVANRLQLFVRLLSIFRVDP